MNIGGFKTDQLIGFDSSPGPSNAKIFIEKDEILGYNIGLIKKNDKK